MYTTRLSKSLTDDIDIGVGRLRILGGWGGGGGGGARFRILGGQGGGQIPSSHMTSY